VKDFPGFTGRQRAHPGEGRGRVGFAGAHEAGV